jgi:hypothetical protein
MQKALKKWDLSDHLPVLTSANLEYTSEVKTGFVYATDLMQKVEVVERFNTDPRWGIDRSLPVDDQYEAIRKIVEELSFELGLKRARKSKKVRLYSSGTRRAIDGRRLYFTRYGTTSFCPVPRGRGGNFSS